MAQQQGLMIADDFDAAFAQLSDLAEGKTPEEPPQTAEAPADDQTDDGAEETLEEGAEGESDEGAEGEDTGGEETAEETDEPTEAKLTDEELLARFAALVKKAEPEPAPKQEPAKAAPRAEEPPLYTKDEEEFLKTYEQDWPDVSKAEALRRRAEYRQLVGYVFQEVAKEFKPIMEAVEVLSTRTHLSDLQSTVTDYEDVRDKVVSWVDTQPAYLQAAYKHVINSGTVEEVADLIDRYKRETGAVQKPVPAPRKEAELPTATKQAAAALAPVSSKRSAVVQAADPNDFEAAFASFADKL